MHPPVGIHLGGLYDPSDVMGQEASFEGAVEGLTITRPIKPFGRSTTGPTGAPQGTASIATANVRSALGAMGSIGPEPHFEVCAFIIRS